MPHRRHRHIIWDWNGTLFDDVGASLATLNDMLRVRGLPAIDRETYLERFGFPVRRFYVGLGFDLEREAWNTIAREFHDRYLVEARKFGLRAGICALLDACAKAGYKQSVLSASEQNILDGMLDFFGIRSYFEHVLGVDNLDGHSKSIAGRELMARIGLPARGVVLVGDTLHDREVAAELGCAVYLLAGGHQHGRRLFAVGSPVAHDLEQLKAWLLGTEDKGGRGTGEAR